MEQAQSRLDALRRQLQPDAASRARMEEAPGAQDSSSHPVVIGAAVVDIQAHSNVGNVEAGGTVPGTVRQTMGGVGRNIAQALTQLGRGMYEPLFISVVGADAAGEAIVSHWKSLGQSCRGILRLSDIATPAVVFCFNHEQVVVQASAPPADGSVAAGVAAVADFESAFTKQLLRQFRGDLERAPLVILDGNLPADVLQEASCLAKAGRARLFFEPVSSAKATRAVGILDSLDYASPNGREVVAMAAAQRAASGLPPLPEAATSPGGATADEEIAALLPHALSLLRAGLKNVVLTLGERGAALLHLVQQGQSGAASCQVHHMPALPVSVANSSGAGDCLVAGMCMRLLQGASAVSSLAHGMAAAQCAVQSSENVPSDLSQAKIAAQARVALAGLRSWTVPATAA